MSVKPNWQNHRVCEIPNLMESRLDTGEDYPTITLGELAKRIKQPLTTAKLAAPLFLPSAYCDYDARSHAAQRERGQFVALVADIDRTVINKIALDITLDKICGEAPYFAYTTASATREVPRWRVVVPLAEPVTYATWALWQDAFAVALKDNDIVVDASADRAGQGQFQPNKGAYYDVLCAEGDCEGFAPRCSKVMQAAIGVVERRREADEAARTEAARLAAERRIEQHSSPVDHFNANVAIADLLTKYGYRQSDDDWQSPHQTSGSYATRNFGSYWVSLSGSDAAAGLGAASNGSRYGDAFDLFVHYEHGGQYDAAVAAAGKEMRAAEIREQRREAQKERDRAIGDDVAVDSCRIGTIDLQYALVNLVFVTDGRRVVDLTQPRVALSIDEARLMYKASKAVIEIGGKEKAVPILSLWEAHEERLTVNGTTFLAGGSAITLDPAGVRCVNTWVPPVRSEPPSDWAERAQPFIDHIRWLFGEDSELHLDWLAHIEQRPGVLPSTGWLHIAQKQGLGRNWISSVLTRVWRGYVASGYDLGGMLSNGFNGGLSRKLLATVDEIDAGLHTYQSAQTLKQAITETYRNINPKYGRQSVEHNAARWLIFSNSATALPLEKGDRRFHVVRCDDDPKPAAYYEHLYGVLDCPKFLASVVHMLSTRDISGFKAGAAPRMSRSKADMIEALTPEAEWEMRRVIDTWPRDLISKGELLDEIGDIQPKYFKRLCAHLGVVSLGRREFGKEVREQRPLGGTDRYVTKVQIFALRNTEKWREAFDNDRELVNQEWVRMAGVGCWIDDADL